MQSTLRTNQDSPEKETEQADLQDLSDALKTNNVAGNQSVIALYRELRHKIASLKQSTVERPVNEDVDQEEPINRNPAEEYLNTLGSLEGLPAEFSLYTKGAIHWHAGHIDEARNSWKQLLALPASERQYRSTWAAYMLAKTYLQSQSLLAKENFDLVRHLVAVGYKDSLSLSRASYGWEAQLAYNANSFSEAIDLYLKQGNEPSAVGSLRWTAIRALDRGRPEELRELAANSTNRNVITACLISQNWREYEYGSKSNQSERVDRWLETLEAASVKDDSLAERLALVAYQAGNMTESKRWIALAPRSVTARWLKAKLLLYEGDLDQAAKILQQLSLIFPILESEKAPLSKLEYGLSIDQSDYERTSGPKQLLGDLGVVQLSRNQFVESLDAFMKAGFWYDAAYVAERVLTLNELQNYIDKNWPAPREFKPATLETDADSRAWALRNLFARRLMRANRLDDARPYFDPECRSVYDTFIKDMRIGFGPIDSAEVRAQHRFHAAKTIRFEGRKLLATEGEPDWNLHPPYACGLEEEDRLKAEEEQLPPTAEEKQRLRASALKHSFRYHFRFVGAELAWRAALLMPNNSEETASVLCQAGSWIKYLDPQRADRFYKSLVRRCRKTEIGETADQMRWFPVLNEEGQLKN